MSAWTTDERATLRALLGYPALFHQFEPRLENAITAVQATADGGSLPDSSTQTRMRAAMAAIASIETSITNLYSSLQVDEAGTDKVVLNSTRALMVLRMEGRRLIGQISTPLGTTPVADYFSGVPVGNRDTDSNPFGWRP